MYMKNVLLAIYLLIECGMLMLGMLRYFEQHYLLFFIFSEIRSYFSEAHFYVFISVPPPPDPDKPVISALGFLGKLPGGKCLLRELAKKHQLLAHQEALLVNVC